MALRASGRLWMTVQTLPDFSMRTLMTLLEAPAMNGLGSLCEA